MSRHRAGPDTDPEAVWCGRWADTLDRLAAADLGPLTAGLMAAARHLRRGATTTSEPEPETDVSEATTREIINIDELRRAG